MLSILLFSLAMLFGCYLVGCIPLAINFSESKLRLITVFGAGLLVGTALSVIIPEGVHAMYSPGLQHQSGDPSLHHSDHGAIIGTNLKEKDISGIGKHPVNQLVIDKPSRRLLQSVKNHLELAHKELGGEAVALPQHHAIAPDQNLPQSNKAAKSLAESSYNHEGSIPHLHNPNSPDPHRLIGLALVLGFVMMLLVDHFAGHSPKTVNSMQNLETGAVVHRQKKLTATIGLVVHAAADGIALGAASSFSHLRVEIIVFVAIMLHKGPAAFGLVTFLLHENWERSKIRRHLLLFSLAAPVAAILTYISLSQHSREQFFQAYATGFALLFSAGTFLYVATVHVLPEISRMSASSSNSEDHRGGFTCLQLILLVAGSLLPLTASITHSH